MCAMALEPVSVPRLARLRVDQVHAMLEAGILREGDPLELIDGVLVYKDRSAAGEDSMTIGKRHNLGIKLLAALDAQLAVLGRHMQTQGPLMVPPHDEPEPDGLILRGRPRDYTERLPVAADVDVVIEVADSSLDHDRTTKLKLYARAGIPQYVIVNVQEHRVEVHERPEPAEARYLDAAVHHGGDLLTLRLGEQALAVTVDALLP